MTNLSLRYYERELGAGYAPAPRLNEAFAYSEPLCRFIQRESFELQAIEIRNTMPSWLPGVSPMVPIYSDLDTNAAYVMEIPTAFTGKTYQRTETEVPIAKGRVRQAGNRLRCYLIAPHQAIRGCDKAWWAVPPAADFLRTAAKGAKPRRLFQRACGGQDNVRNRHRHTKF